jgi:DNA helicase-2/ATP-dependent DNA helicase PcrA
MAKSSDEIEEERRLLYVAITRAKDELNLVVPHRFFTYNPSKVGDRHVYAALTRFIPDSIKHHFERRNETALGAVTRLSNRKSGAKIDVAAGVKRLWG